MHSVLQLAHILIETIFQLKCLDAQQLQVYSYSRVNRHHSTYTISSKSTMMARCVVLVLFGKHPSSPPSPLQGNKHSFLLMCDACNIKLTLALMLNIDGNARKWQVEA